MKIWLTARYDPNGIEEIEIDGEPNGDVWTSGYMTNFGWYREGYSWHRTEKAAVEMARQHRANWIAETTAEAAKVSQLPAIA